MVFCIAEAVMAVIWLVITVKKKQTGSRRRAPVILLVIGTGNCDSDPCQK